MQMSLLKKKKRKKIGANFVSPNLNTCTQIMYLQNVSLKGVKNICPIFSLFIFKGVNLIGIIV